MCRLLQHFLLLLVPPFTLVLFLQNVLMIRVLDARRKNPLFWFLCPFTCIETKIIFIYTSICPHLRYEIFVRYNQLWWLYISQIRFIQFVEIKFKNLKWSSGFPNYDLCSPFPPREGGGGAGEWRAGLIFTRGPEHRWNTERCRTAKCSTQRCV